MLAASVDLASFEHSSACLRITMAQGAARVCLRMSRGGRRRWRARQHTLPDAACPIGYCVRSPFERSPSLAGRTTAGHWQIICAYGSRRPDAAVCRCVKAGRCELNALSSRRRAQHPTRKRHPPPEYPRHKVVAGIPAERGRNRLGTLGPSRSSGHRERCHRLGEADRWRGCSARDRKSVPSLPRSAAMRVRTFAHDVSEVESAKPSVFAQVRRPCATRHSRERVRPAPRARDAAQGSSS